MKRAPVFMLLTLLLLTLTSVANVGAQTETPPAGVIRLMETLSPEERVGQLFLVSFKGTETSGDSNIYDLIVNYHIGGVVLMAENDNFLSEPETISSAHQLINELQRIEWENFIAVPDGINSDGAGSRAYIPLLIGVEQDGGGYPADQILSGVTGLPNAMSLGATWKPELANQIGAIQGKDLAALGINLLLGPSLDVLDTPNPNARGDINTRSFGGDPYWVGEMGRAFISGLHTGSNGRLLVIAKHFPGLGGSDRPADEEVATVRKSLEQLKQIELAPFFAVTGHAPDSLSTADGLLVSHIRFQGFQGNIRATTRPVSFDQQALSEILALPELSEWHASNGLIVSDDLGSQAVTKFYAPANTTFSAQLVARDAFLAGNDLLFLGNITSGESDTYSTTIDVLNFFAQRYREDPAFAQLVDAAATRILTRKYELYKRFTVSDVLVPDNAILDIGESQQPVFEVARRSATLISPDTQELSSLFPSPPSVRDRLVFITDAVKYTQCSDCPELSSLSVTALQDAIVRLYGPTAGGQVSEARMSSYSFNDLHALLSAADVEFMENDINRADWIIIALGDASFGQPELISRFLSERQDLLRDKRVILFSFTGPYYLDATDISRLTAYYGLYSKQPEFIDVAARLLYQELTPLGYSPVSIPGTGYDLIDVTRPDPEQVISLILDTSPINAITDQAVTPEPTPIPLLRIGDTIYVRTGVIYDHNGHTVPDGTVVQFTILLSGESGGIIQQLDQITSHGVAQASFSLDKPGLVEVRASSEPAALSEVIQIDVSSGEAAAVTVIAPVPLETTASTPESSPAIIENEFITPEGFPRLSAWILTMVFIILSTLAAYWVGGRFLSRLWAGRWAVCTLLGGLLGYNYVAFGFPGSTVFVLTNSLLGVIGISLMGVLLGLGAAWIWSKWG